MREWEVLKQKKVKGKTICYTRECFMVLFVNSLWFDTYYIGQASACVWAVGLVSSSKLLRLYRHGCWLQSALWYDLMAFSVALQSLVIAANISTCYMHLRRVCSLSLMTSDTDLWWYTGVATTLHSLLHFTAYAIDDDDVKAVFLCQSQGSVTPLCMCSMLYGHFSCIGSPLNGRSDCGLCWH